MSEIPKCHKCGCTDKRLFHHHKSYNPEIIVLVCMPCHKKIHIGLRFDGACDIPPDELTEMSNKSNYAQKRKHEHYIEHMDVYKERSKQYHKTHKVFNKCSYYTMMSNVQLIERIRINIDNDYIGVYSGFRAMHSKRLYFIDLD